MNFEFDLNLLLPHEITKFNSDLRIIHPSYLPQDDPSLYQLNRDLKQKVAYLIDKIGEASSKSQGLRDTITTFRKFNLNDNHRIYLMKDPQGNNGKGSLVGLLKVGEKKLFVHDTQGQTHEMTPLCVLDFYVYDNQQRKGYGLQMFNKMLEMENVRVEHLAVDSPSEKSMRFLKKHYNLKNPINQVNNFVVFGGFFENRPGLLKRNNRKIDSFSAQPYRQQHEQLPPLEPRFFNRSDTADSKLKPYGDQFYNSKNNSLINLNYQPVQNFAHLQNNSSFLFNSKSANAIDNRSYTEPFINTNRGVTPKTNENPNNNNNNNNNQIKYNTYYEAHFSNQNKYDPFPSLNPLYNRTNVITQKPPLPPPNENINYKPPIPNNNLYNPFPSLTAIKSNTNTDLYGNQFFINSKFRRTKLW